MKSFIAITASIMLLAGSAFAVTQGNSFAVGSDAQGIELYSGVLQPITNGGVALGGSANQFSSLYLSGTATIGTAAITSATITTGTVTTLTSSTATVTTSLSATIATVNVAVTTPTAVGQLRCTTAGKLYISTSAVDLNSWVVVGGQS